MKTQKGLRTVVIIAILVTEFIALYLISRPPDVQISKKIESTPSAVENGDKVTAQKSAPLTEIPSRRSNVNSSVASDRQDNRQIVEAPLKETSASLDKTPPGEEVSEEQSRSVVRETESDEVFLQRFLSIKQSPQFELEFETATREVFAEYTKAIEEQNLLKEQVATLQERLTNADEKNRNKFQTELEATEVNLRMQETKVMELGERFMDLGDKVHLRYFTQAEIIRGTNLMAKMNYLPIHDFREWQASQK